MGSQHNASADNSLLEGFFRTYRYLPRRERRLFFLQIAGMMIAAALELAALGTIALLATAVTDADTILNSGALARVRSLLGLALAPTQNQLILWLSGATLVAVCIKNLMQSFMAYVTSRFACDLEVLFGIRLMQGFLSMPYQRHLTQNSADLVLAVDWRVYFGRAFFLPVLQMLSDILMVAFLLGALVIAEPLISLLVIGTLGILSTLLFLRIRSRLDRISTRCRQLHQDINKHVTKSIHGIKDVIIAGQQAVARDEFGNRAQILSRSVTVQEFLSRVPAWLLETLGVAILVGAICAMVLLLDFSTARITSSLALLVLTAWRVLPAAGRILGSLTKIRKSMPYLTSELDYIDANVPVQTTEPVQQDDRELQFSRIDEINMEHVDFTYDGAEVPALQDVSVTIRGGEMLGLVGRSGAGKSTLVDLLIGLLPRGGGRILVNGVDLDGLTPAQWMRHISYVPQDPYIFEGTLAQNVAFSLSPATIDRERVRISCQQAEIDFADLGNGGLDMALGERGALLSGGQRQRIAIARALYKDSPLIVFDEATSALDHATEQAILKTIEGLRSNRTLILVTHRLTTVRHCDQLILLEPGRPPVAGTPQDILGRYGQPENEEQ